MVLSSHHPASVGRTPPWAGGELLLLRSNPVNPVYFCFSRRSLRFNFYLLLLACLAVQLLLLFFLRVLGVLCGYRFAVQEKSRLSAGS